MKNKQDGVNGVDGRFFAVRHARVQLEETSASEQEVRWNVVDEVRRKAPRGLRSEAAEGEMYMAKLVQDEAARRALWDGFEAVLLTIRFVTLLCFAAEFLAHLLTG